MRAGHGEPRGTPNMAQLAHGSQSPAPARDSEVVRAGGDEAAQRWAPGPPPPADQKALEEIHAPPRPGRTVLQGPLTPLPVTLYPKPSRTADSLGDLG